MVRCQKNKRHAIPKIKPSIGQSLVVGVVAARCSQSVPVRMLKGSNLQGGDTSLRKEGREVGGGRGSVFGSSRSYGRSET